MVRDGKPTGFFYLDHRTVDGKHAIITDTHVTPASVHDSVPYLARLDHQCQRFGLDPIGVGLDAGYFTAAICRGLEERGLYGVIGYRRPSKLKGYLPKRAFTYDAATDTYQCPEGQSLIYATTDRNGYRHYRSDPEICRGCPRLDTCTRNARQMKTVTRHVWQDDKDRVDARRLTEPGKKLYKRRKETVERSFADAKQLHGHRYARMRGLARVKEQCLLAAACQNLKKIAQARWRRFFYVFLRHLRAHMAYQGASCPRIIRERSIWSLASRRMWACSESNEPTEIGGFVSSLKPRSLSEAF